MLWVSLESFDGELQTKHVGNPKPHGFRVWGFLRFRFQGACLSISSSFNQYPHIKETHVPVQSLSISLSLNAGAVFCELRRRHTVLVVDELRDTRIAPKALGAIIPRTRIRGALFTVHLSWDYKVGGCGRVELVRSLH